MTRPSGALRADPRAVRGAVLSLVLLLLSLGTLACEADEPAAETTSTSVARTEDTAGTAGEVDPELAERTRRFVSLVAAGDFEGATALFDDQMRAALSSDQLQELWSGVEARLGAFEAVESLEQAEESGFRVVYALTRFADESLRIKTVYGEDGKLAGLFFQSVTADADGTAADYDPPAYVDPELYTEREVETGTAGWTLPGTLTIPAGGGPFAGVVLVHGSGPSDRDETIGPNRPFRDLALGLASQGIAVLRYEKRTKEHAARLDAGSVTIDTETVDDAVAALSDLAAFAEVDDERVFVVGHSLGGMLAPRIGERALDAGSAAPAGLVLLAAGARPLEELVLDQVRYLAELDEDVTEEEEAEITKLEAAVERVSSGDFDESTPPSDLPLGAPPAYWASLSGYDPVVTAAELDLPLLILQGGRDYQVTEDDLLRWRAALGEDPQVQTTLLPDLNHLFMAGEGPSSPEEYAEAGHVDEAVIEAIAAFVLEGVR